MKLARESIARTGTLKWPVLSIDLNAIRGYDMCVYVCVGSTRGDGQLSTCLGRVALPSIELLHGRVVLHTESLVRARMARSRSLISDSERT